MGAEQVGQKEAAQQHGLVGKATYIMNNNTQKTFKIIMTLTAIFTAYAALFFYGDAAQLGAPMAKSQPHRFAALGSAKIKYQTLIESAAERHDVPAALVAAVMHAESNFNPRAVSPMGAMGLMQINGQTQRYLRVRNIFDPSENVHAGARYLKELLSQFGGNMRLALAAYNAGPGAVRKYGGVPPYAETRRYVVKVMGLYLTYKNKLPGAIMVSQKGSIHKSLS